MFSFLCKNCFSINPIHLTFTYHFLANTVKSLTEITRSFILSPFAYLLLAVVAAGIALVFGVMGMKSGMMVFAVVVGIPLLLACLADLKIGVSIILVAGYFLMGLKRIIGGDPPLGILLDLMMFLLFVGLLIKQLFKRDWSFLNHIVTFTVLVWILFNFIELFNPVAASRMAWFYTVRGMAGLTILFVIALYVFDSLQFIKTMIKMFIGLAMLACLYGIWQEYVGFTQAELNWIYEDPKRFELIFQWGRFRIFSFLSDPTAYGILMAYMGVFCLVLATGPYTIRQKIILAICGALMMLPVGYAGTRTAYVLIPAGFMFYVLLNPSRNVMISVIFFMLIGTAMMMKSTSNPIIYRIQSAFTPQEDASMQLRLDNQKFIQPFIQSHPIGGGLGSTGVWGQRFSPNTLLANFPPDSGYVRTAVEQGWLGLLLQCTMLCIAMVVSVRYYIRVNDPIIKNLYQALLVLMFLLVLANYPQEAIILLPNSIIFYLTLAMLVRLKDFDTIAPAKNQ